MGMIIDNVAALSGDWRAWVVAALVTLKAMHSFFLYLRCPVSRGVAEITPDMISAGKEFKFRPPPSYAAIMLGGMALATAGLFLLSDAEYGPLALGSIVIGVFMFVTEPTRLFVNNAIMAVYGSVDAEGDANVLARDQLRAAHRERATYELIIAAIVLAVLFYL